MFTFFVNMLKRKDGKVYADLHKTDERIYFSAAFKADYTRTSDHLGSVELALTREIERLRHLERRVHPAEPDEGEEP